MDVYKNDVEWNCVDVSMLYHHLLSTSPQTLNVFIHLKFNVIFMIMEVKERCI